MALDKQSAGLDITGAYINNLISEQSWYKENSNTIAVIGGFIATAIAYFGSLPIADDPKIQAAIFVIGFILTIFGVKMTPNGFSKSQVKKIANARADYLAEQPLVVPEDEDEGNVDQELAAYIQARE